MVALRILGICGSLRRESYNRLALGTAREQAPDGVVLETFDRLRDIPPYDDDLRAAAGFPAAVGALREAIRAADALLFVSPEYNYSVPGQLKNAIDWASRAPDQPFQDKPVAIMGASPGVVGTARMQHHLRQCLVFLDARVLSRPEVMIGQVAGKFDASGRLVDEATAQQIKALLTALQAWTLRLRR
jgi:chromate reductase, NAD(P)H dehydrogenase (quinone)